MKIFGMVTTRPSAALTPYALKSFFECTSLEPEDRFYLIDNDRCADCLGLQSIGSVEIIRNHSPLGFAANVNKIMRLASLTGADLYFLNNDIIFTPGWIEPLNVPEKAVLSPLSNWQFQYSAGGFHCRRVMDLPDYLGHEEHLKAVALDHARHHQGTTREFSVWFFCVKIPFTVYREVGALDEAFGRGGGEDVDYCLRCHLARIRVGFAAKSFVLHFMGKSTWRGEETDCEKKERENTYRSAFERKWGSSLSRLALFGDRGSLETRPDLIMAYSLGNFKELIESACNDPAPRGKDD